MSTTIPNDLPSPDRRVGDRASGRDGRTRSPRLRLAPGAGAAQLSLPYEYEVAPGIPAVPPAPAGLRVVAPEPSDPHGGLRDPGPWVAKLARAIAEVSVGERPPGQLTQHVARDELARLARRGQYVARHPSARMQRGVSRLRTVSSVRVCPVAPGIVETSAVLVSADRAQAIAIRLEAVSGRWVATAVQLG